MPRYDFAERHATRVSAPPERVWAAIRELRSESRVIKLLMAIRSGGMAKVTDLPFSVVAENPPHEIVRGIAGPFWRLTCKPRPVTLDDYRRPVRDALAAWNFAFDGHVLSTETRVLCSDETRRRFGMYWFFIRPGSGLIRRAMLRSIRRQAERA